MASIWGGKRNQKGCGARASVDLGKNVLVRCAMLNMVSVTVQAAVCGVNVECPNRGDGPLSGYVVEE